MLGTAVGNRVGAADGAAVGLNVASSKKAVVDEIALPPNGVKVNADALMSETAWRTTETDIVSGLKVSATSVVTPSVVTSTPLFRSRSSIAVTSLALSPGLSDARTAIIASVAAVEKAPWSKTGRAL